MVAIAALVPVLHGPPVDAGAAGPGAVVTPVGYDANRVARGDDTSNLVVNLPFTMNWNGTSRTQVYINMNGNCTFGAGYTGYNPTTSLAALDRDIMAPFWADVDTRNAATAQVTYSSTAAGSIPQVGGRNAFIVNWIGVATYNNQAAPLNSFQLVIVDRSDTGAGNFDFMFNYDQVTWDIATAASTYRARVGWGQAGTGFELPGSGVAQGSLSTLLDSSAAATSLTQNSLNAGGQLGRYVWQVRGGAQPNSPPSLAANDRVLEGNAPMGYAGFTGAGDVTATDADGTVASLSSDLPALLPLGVTDVAWTAVDDDGAMTVAHQLVTVHDTTPPSNPTLASPTHATGAWSKLSTATVDSLGDAADVCAGVTGFSYGWSSGAPVSPDTTPDAHTTRAVTTAATTTVDAQTFPNSTWPAEWTRSSTSWVRLTNAAGRSHGSYAAEIWASNASRRTADFYRDYDLTGYTGASLSLWSQLSALSTTADYARIEYSVDGGTSWTRLHSATGGAVAQVWQQRSFSLPAGGTVRVRFSGSVNSASEYAGWDDVTVLGFTTSTTQVMTTSSTEQLADGTWYYGLRTMDGEGNWSVAASLGPFLIDTVPPVTTDDAPAGWARAPVTVTLTPTDAGVIDRTEYALDGVAWTAYAGGVTVSAEGTTTLTYRSVDAAGHVESVRSALVRVDTQLPTSPGVATALATGTDTIELSWGSSSDVTSGLHHYLVYRDGVLAGASTGTSYDDVGLTPGESYGYEIAAVDAAGNISGRTAPVTGSVPVSGMWLSVTPPTIEMGATDPGTSTVMDEAVRVSVGGVGEIAYELSCNAAVFADTDTGTPTQYLPVSALAFAVRGETVLPSQPFSTTPALVDSAVGTEHGWSRDYLFDLRFDVPWSFDAGTYATTVTYTAIAE